MGTMRTSTCNTSVRSARSARSTFALITLTCMLALSALLATPHTASAAITTLQCRILDTRLTNGPTGTNLGPLSASTLYAFNFKSPAPGQGAESGCALPSAATHMYANVTFLWPANSGVFKIWKTDGTEPMAVSVTYPGGGLLTGGSFVTDLCDGSGCPLSEEVYVKVSSTTGIVIDIVGWE